MQAGRLSKGSGRVQANGDGPPYELCERTFQFAVRIVNASRELERKGGIARTIGRQLLRSGTSVGANVEEGQGSHSRADFAAKYGIARKEARESLYWIRLLVASEILPESKLASLAKEADELVAILTAILKKVRDTEK